MKEITNLRKPKEKHFLCNNGKIKVYTYDIDVHYFDGKEYKEIDNTLEERNNGYNNISNDFKVFFPKFLENNYLFKVNTEEYYLSADLIGKGNNPTVITDKNTVLFKNIFDNCDLKYYINGKKLKEDIIIHSNVMQKISFILKTDLILEDKGLEILGTKNNKILYKIEKPFGVNAKGVLIENLVTYNLTKIDDAYQIDYLIDTSKVKEDDYPIVIDPTIDSSETSVYDTYIYSGDTNIDRNSQEYLKIGVDSNNIAYRSLIKFDLPELSTGAQILNASLILITHPSDYAVYDFYHEYVSIHQITEDWDELTANWNTMNDKYNTTKEYSSYLLRSVEEMDENNELVISLSYNTLDITNIVRKWYSGTANYGVMLKFDDEVYNEDCKEYYVYSKNNTAQETLGLNPQPSLIIEYRIQNGLLDYMNYNLIEYSDGISYINNYNGNVVNIFDINKTNNIKNPVKLSIVNNTNDVYLGNYKNGWKFNFDQEVTKLEDDEYKFINTSGAEIYFYKDPDSDKYVDEDGYNMELNVTDEGFTIIDSKGYCSYFTLVNSKYKLTKITDIKDKSTIIEYNSDKLAKITDNLGNTITLTYETDSIVVNSDVGTAIIFLENDTVSHITTINGTTLFSYDNNIINKITDLNGTYKTYEHFSTIPYRIKIIKEYGINNTERRSTAYEYGFNETIITNALGIQKTYTFDSYGRVSGITVFNENGLLKNSYGLNQSLNGENQIEDATDIIRYVKNQINNASFENEIDYNEEIYITGGERSNDYARTGLYSYKSVNGNSIKLIITNRNFGENYVVSGYIKSNAITFVYLDKYTGNKLTILDSLTLPPHEDFTKFEIPFTFPDDGSSYINVEIFSQGNDDFYLDDIQLEQSEVSNAFNILSNSDFSEDLSSWSIIASDDDGNEILDPCEIVMINDEEYALKINSQPNGTISVSQKFDFSGKAGDVYNLSFWYKSEGVFDPIDLVVGNLVNVQFVSDDDTGTEPFTIGLGRNNSSWQFFTESFVAETDFNSLSLNFISMREINCLYITNIMLVKDLGQYKFIYDDNGNVISMADLNGSTEKQSFDSNNQLISKMTSDGAYYNYEYDNDTTDRLLCGISPCGLTNKIKYDSNGNATKLIIKKTSGGLEINTKYNIRQKGTNNYLDCNDGSLLTINNNTCSHDVFMFSEQDGYYYIKCNEKYVTVSESSIVLSSYATDNSLFNIYRNDNGSYTFYVKDTVNNCILIKENEITLGENTDNEYSQFYLEENLSSKFIETTAEYDEEGQYITKLSDSLGNEIKYETDTQTGKVTSITNSLNQETKYIYDTTGNIKKIIYNNKSINYEYITDKLSKIISDDNTFETEYDEFYNVKSTKINGVTLITNEYNVLNKLCKSTYGNGSLLTLDYDEFGRLKSLVDDENSYSIFYDNLGNLAKILSDNESHLYYYDFASRLKQHRKMFGNNFYNIYYDYDNANNVTSKQLFSYDGSVYNINYMYDNDGIIKEINYDDNYNLSLDYDDLNRLNYKILNNSYTMKYSYLGNGDKTTTIIKTMQIGEDVFEYKYNSLGNITSIYKNNELINEYKYDNYNQLILDNNYIQSKTYKYIYDNNGNILEKQIYYLNTNKLLDRIMYYYENSLMPDQLTKYDDEIISYDAIGNVISIGNNTLAWTNGKQLKSFSNDTINVTYLYDKDGIRYNKTVNNVTTNYFTEDGHIILETTSGNVIYYLRDDLGDLIGFKYNDTIYYYVKNVQEDIVGIMDSTYNLIASYCYDSFGSVTYILDSDGNEITDTSNIAYINPFRYKSYYFDTETGLYYVNSRYYNPKWGRFISCDTSTINGAFGTNLYIYCNNDFVNKAEVDGQFPWPVATAAAGLVIGVVTKMVSNAVTNKPISNGILGAAVGGAISGALLGFSASATAILVAGVVAENAANEITKYIPKLSNFNNSTNKISVTKTNIVNSVESFTINTASDIVTSYVTGGVADMIVPLNIKYWIKPQKLSTCFIGRYACKVNANNLISEGIQIFIDWTSNLSTTDLNNPEIQLYPNKTILAN